MENKGFLGLFVLLGKEIVGFLKEILIGGNERELLRFAGVKKGFKNGLKYFLMLFILPIKLGRYVANPDLRVYYYIEKMVTPFLFISDVLTGQNNNVVSTTYEGFLHKIKEDSSSELSANLSDLDKFRTLFTIRKVITAFLFVVFVVFFGFYAMELVSGLADSINIAGLGGGLFLGDASFMAIFSSLSVFAIFYIIIGLVTLSFLGFMFFMFLRVSFYIIRDAYVLPKEDMERFLCEIVEFTYRKAKQIYGEELASKALKITIENFVLEDEKIDMLKDKELVSQKDFLEKK